MSSRAFVRYTAIALAALVVASCSSNPSPKAPPPANIAPKYPDYPVPVIPEALKVTPEIRDLQDVAWRRLQAGDLRGASRDFGELLKRSPNLYPAETGLGYASLAGRDFKPAAAHFLTALTQDNKYLPAWQGLAEAHLAGGNTTEAMAALERVVTLDPKSEAAKTRLELLRFRQVQSLIDMSRKERQSGRLEDAQASLERALGLSPSSVLILRELSVVEAARGALDPAEAHARRAIQLDAGDADSQAQFGAVLEARGRLREAANVYAKAASIDPKWKEKAEDLKDKADMAAVPAEYRAMPTAETVTRAEVAALIGIKLESLIDKAPKRATAVATDVRTHWAAPWILPVTQAGVMDISPNHTFQPAAIVRRDHLAQIVSQLVPLAVASRPADLAKWRAARPKFADLSTSNVYYGAAALAVSVGAMTAADDRFQPTRPATGQEVVAAIARIGQLTSR